MKVYFTGQLYRKEDYLAEYKKIISVIEFKGHTVLQDTMEYEASEVLSQSEDTLKNYYVSYFKFLRDADICVAEISFPSTVNIGFDVANMINKGKPVIALYREGEDPKFISPNYSQKMIKLPYILNSLEETLSWGLEEAEALLNRRFTMNLPAEMDRFLARASKKRKTTRSDLIRDLIQKEMESSSS